MMSLIASIWGILGVLMLLTFAVARLTPIALGIFDHELMWHHWVILTATVAFMAYSEGYRGFHLSFSPRVAARTLYLSQNPTLLHTLLSPFFCMGFIHARKSRKIAAFALTFMIIIFVVLAQKLAQPWRGILDAGVVVGLSIGIISLIYWLAVAFTSSEFTISPELPVEEN